MYRAEHIFKNEYTFNGKTQFNLITFKNLSFTRVTMYYRFIFIKMSIVFEPIFIIADMPIDIRSLSINLQQTESCLCL